MKKRHITLLIFMLIILLSACSKENEKDEQTDSNFFPLTGLKTAEAVNNRIVGVMVNNHPNARPQSGLSKADIVFEILAEGDITRFLALYQSEKPEVVGPVRSAREYYFELANRYDALYVYHGAAEFINERIKDRGIDYINGSLYDNDQHLFKRESFRKAPHNSYLQFGAVYDTAKAKGYEMKHDYQPLPFLKSDEKIAGDSAHQVEIDYGKSNQDRVIYRYEENKEEYIRYNGEEQSVEYNTEEPIQTANVFIVEADHEIIDKEGRRSIDLASGGNAYLLQKGKVQKVQWINSQGRIVPKKNGEEVGFIPGKTWINVVPSDPGMQQSVHISND